ncbi:YopX family protein, partial [Streptococcus pneumoniae]|nr:YopX family protein [Streptococcus pneumoniae]
EFELNDTLRNDYITAYPDEIELMQSTGLKDKNGKEIFEGDIVRTTRFLGRADEIGGFYEYDKEFIGIVKQIEGSWVI